jgi:hypothetical protein
LVGTGKSSVKYVHGLLLVGELTSNQAAKIVRLAGSDIRVETYSDLLKRSREYYDHVDKALTAMAPEYARARRKSKVTATSAIGRSVPKKKKAVRKRQKNAAAKKASPN